jgi:hypothetical protein
MRKLVPVAAAIATSVSVLALPAALAYAAAPVHVLTIKKVGGPAVKVGAVLKSGLAKGKTAVFSLGAEKLTCKSANFSAKVKINPAKPGTATESLTAETFAKCTVNVSGVVVKSIKVINLPFKTTASDATGLPVTVSGTKTKPIKITAKVAAGTTNVVCTYKATSVKGSASNTGSTVTFSKQKFTFVSGSSGLCPASANFSATFGPVKDTSVATSPAVFVN